MNNINGNNTRLAACITILIVISTLILDRLIPEGIFLDGVTYAAISRNLAIGKGTFWNLYYRGGWGFNEHPPLMFGMQALFFKIFGDHYLTEKIYSFAIWLATAVLIRQVWNKSLPDDRIQYSYGLPLLLWCIVPTVTWGYTNNILDCTMALFDLAAVWVIYKAVTNTKGIATLAAGGLLIFAAVLTKGPVGAFPLAVPGLYWLVYQSGNMKQLGKAVLQTLLLIAVVAGCVGLIYAFPEPRANLERYIEQQLMAALAGDREITGGGLGRFALLYELLMQMLPPLVLSALIITGTKLLKLNTEKIPGSNKKALFFLLVGICASLPIMMSVKQRSFYLVPSLPFYILSLAIMVYPNYLSLTERYRVGNKGLRYFRIAAITISLALCVYLGSKVGVVGRDHEHISKMKYLGQHFPKGQVFGICAEADKDYGFLAYLQRYNRMEVNTYFYYEDYVLIDKTACNNDILLIIAKLGFKKQEFGLEPYDLYRRPAIFRFDFTLLHPAFRTGGK